MEDPKPDAIPMQGANVFAHGSEGANVSDVANSSPAASDYVLDAARGLLERVCEQDMAASLDEDDFEDETHFDDETECARVAQDRDSTMSTMTPATWSKAVSQTETASIPEAEPQFQPLRIDVSALEDETSDKSHALESKDKDMPQSPGFPRRRPKRAQEDIFRDFSRSHESNIIQEVKVGGVMIQRFNMKHFWNSDHDLTRWRRSLGDRTRFDRLLDDVSYTYNPEYSAEKADLAQNHNALFRQRSSMDDDKVKRHALPLVKELKHLQNNMTPKAELGKQKNFREDLLGDTFSPSLFGGRQKSYDEKDEACSSPKSNGSHEELESIRPRTRSDSRQTPRATPSSSSALALAALPAMEEYKASTFSRDLPALMTRSTEATSRKSPSSVVKHGKTFALLVFRNGDLWHCGETVFFKKAPTTMADVHHSCGRACKAVVMPVGALYDSSLRLVRDVEELKPENPYLMKGQECLDPPPSFFTASCCPGRSLRSLTVSKEASHADNTARLLANPSRAFAEAFAPAARRTQNALKVSSTPALPSVGSPPWSSQPELVPQRAGAKWKAKTKLGASLSWGGLGQAPMHHTYSTWLPVLDRKHREALRH